ncbi:MAG: hypothetical protein ACI9SE_001428 [Neolewinella sp.]|jgi:hypothetical protein
METHVTVSSAKGLATRGGAGNLLAQPSPRIARLSRECFPSRKLAFLVVGNPLPSHP